MEPTGEPFTDYAAIDVAVVPGMGFDTSCRRLGRGKGYYDRLLPKAANACKIGVCFGFQLLASIPADGHDVKMDRIITHGWHEEFLYVLSENAGTAPYADFGSTQTSVFHHAKYTMYQSVKGYLPQR